jgi:hypothetical protein
VPFFFFGADQAKLSNEIWRGPSFAIEIQHGRALV